MSLQTSLIAHEFICCSLLLKMNLIAILLLLDVFYDRMIPKGYSNDVIFSWNSNLILFVTIFSIVSCWCHIWIRTSPQVNNFNRSKYQLPPLIRRKFTRKKGTSIKILRLKRSVFHFIHIYKYLLLILLLTRQWNFRYVILHWIRLIFFLILYKHLSEFLYKVD